jgi:hypothetical protein
MPVLEGDVEGLPLGTSSPHQSTSQKSLEVASLMVGVMWTIAASVGASEPL